MNNPLYGHISGTRKISTTKIVIEQGDILETYKVSSKDNLKVSIAHTDSIITRNERE